jgi:hypothetical protein
MKAQALEIAASVADPGERLNRLREYLQALVLRSLHESEAFRCLSFVGGTALRFLYGLPRFSEDLDFSLENAQGYAPQPWLGKLKRDLAFAGFEPTVTWNDRKTVQVGWVRVAGLLQEAGLAGLPGQKLSVKLEIDTRPPSGAALESRAVNRYFLMAFRHPDLPSLMAGKVHALCVRKYPKGRDWYDLLWYRAQSPPVSPNLRLLQAALDQTEGARAWPAEGWREVLRRRLRTLDVDALRDDVTPFLERPEDRVLLTKEHLIRAIEGDK